MPAFERDALAEIAIERRGKRLAEGIVRCLLDGAVNPFHDNASGGASRIDDPHQAQQKVAFIKVDADLPPLRLGIAVDLAISRIAEQGIEAPTDQACCRKIGQMHPEGRFGAFDKPPGAGVRMDDAIVLIHQHDGKRHGVERPAQTQRFQRTATLALHSLGKRSPHPV